MSIVNIKLSDAPDGLNVFVNIEVTDFDKESIAVALGERVQDYLNQVIADAQAERSPLLPEKKLIVPSQEVLQ